MGFAGSLRTHGPAGFQRAHGSHDALINWEYGLIRPLAAENQHESANQSVVILYSALSIPNDKAELSGLPHPGRPGLRPDPELL